MKRLFLVVILMLCLSGCALAISAATTVPSTTASAASTDLPVTTAEPTTTVLDFAGLNHINGYDEIFDRSTSTYIVYLYSLSCHNCSTIKQQVHDFATTYTAHPVYFLNVETVDSDGREDYLAATGQDSVGVPCMVLVSGSGSFDPEETGAHLARGSSAVLELIAAIQGNSVPSWN
ncbi:MAG TPA: hypothetical protein DCR44_06765 [Acholeplasmatales bacterium]|nr:MAG: hypothetical protein A2Y16_01880 [Tenericutes bacterium GWF2_57_13]HAQ57081.1 hypothetical protein [Acholeplasmatales bacterium]